MTKATVKSSHRPILPPRQLTLVESMMFYLQTDFSRLAFAPGEVI